MRWVLVAVAGGVGALLRAEVAARLPGGIGTAVVNVVGAWLLGLVVALAAAGRVGGTVVLVVGTGLLGGLTTFSTWMVEGVDAGWHRGAALVAGQLVAGVAGAGAAVMLLGG